MGDLTVSFSQVGGLEKRQEKPGVID